MVTDLELERAKQLLSGIRLDALKAWVNQSIKNTKLRADVEALPEALKVVLARLQRRMNELTTRTEERDRARKIALTLFQNVELADLNGEQWLYIDQRMGDDFGSMWRTEIGGWPEN